MINCVTLKVMIPKEKEEIFLQDISKIDNLKDYFYLFYEDHTKLCLVELENDYVKRIMDDLKNNKKIYGYTIVEEENFLDISKILACASRKISQYLQEKVKPLTVDGLVTELVGLSEINASAYVPLHFICNQLKLIDKETEIRFKLATNPKYLFGYKQVGNLIIR